MEYYNGPNCDIPAIMEMDYSCGYDYDSQRIPKDINKRNLQKIQVGKPVRNGYFAYKYVSDPISC